MSVKQGTDLLTPVDTFHIRNGLDQEDKLACHEFVRNAFPGKNIEEPACQGYCSLTFFVGDDIIVQFRPSQYKLNLQITRAAQEIYGIFCPRTTYVATLAKSGLLVYSMNRLSGVSYRDFRASNTALANSTTARATLCKDFATFLAVGWHRRDFISLPFGIVGSSLTPRLELLCRNLPSRFRPTANRILKNIQHIESLPWILSHGDILPSNMIIDPLTQHLVGLVDWAEAEPLPFGTCFYGLEEILGEITPIGFNYHPDAIYLREVFWTELTIRIPELRSDSLIKRVRIARDLGVLLWHGIAWDDGAINRVVVDGRKDDVDEIWRLDAFLDVAGDADLTINSTTSLENPSKL